MTRKILVVEDDAMIAEAITDIISILGHQVIWFESGPEALLMSESTRFDLAIIDLELPAMPGVEVADRLNELQPDIQILYVTGFSEQEERIDVSLPHVAGILHKPFEMVELQEAVENTLSSA
jgi:DNA-binding response OmpR family regulator